MDSTIDIKEEFAKYLLKYAPPAYSAYLGKTTGSIVKRLEEINSYFIGKDLFKVNKNNYRELIEYLQHKNGKKERLKNKEFYDYDRSKSKGIPIAIMGKENYFKFLESFDFENGGHENELSKALQPYIAEYKDLITTSKDYNEIYKWEAVANFNENWNLNANDLVSMIERSFPGNNNLWSSQNYYPITMLKTFAENNPSKVQLALKNLFDESTPLENRILSYKETADELLSENNELRNENNKHNYQDARTMSILLSFKYPAKHSLFKHSVLKRFCEAFELDSPKTGDLVNQILINNEINRSVKDIITKDEELLQLHNERLTPGSYREDDNNILTQDFIYSTFAYAPDENAGDLENHGQKEHPMNFPINTILYGPPGTGKTYNTLLRAAEIIENRRIDTYSEALEIFRDNLHNTIEFITFHQNYSYEDFIQGLRPDTENDKELTFERKDGVFKIIADKALKNLKESEKPPIAKRQFEEVFNQFINPLIEGEFEKIEVKMKRSSYFITAITNKSIDFQKASGGSDHTLSIGTLRKMYEAESVMDIQGLSSYYSPLLDVLLNLGKDASGKKEKISKKNFVIIIDEINRANISRVFGELITLIEPDKRSHGALPLEARLPSGDSFTVPSNLYIIGTMNTADKSIALLDIALRRRFEFESMYPKYEIKGQEIYDVEILRKINEQIIKSKGHDFQIGHAYFMGENKDLVQRMNKKVIPLLLEYYMNDDKEVKGILQLAGLSIEEGSWPIRITGKHD